MQIYLFYLVIVLEPLLADRVANQVVVMPAVGVVAFVDHHRTQLIVNAFCVGLKFVDRQCARIMDRSLQLSMATIAIIRK